MLKKIIVIVLLLICSGCQKKQIEYIEPINNVFMFSELEDEELKKDLLEANNNIEWSNYQFNMLDIAIPNGTFFDIEGNPINFSDYEKICFEVVSVNCPLCKLQSSHLDSLLEEDITFIQYFNDGDKEDILRFYEEKPIKDIIIIAKNDELKDYIENTLKIELYPTIVCFNKERVVLSSVGDIYLKTFEKIKELSFEKIIDSNRLINSKGENILELSRDIDDLKNDLSLENKNALLALDNDNHTSIMTYEVLGKRIDFENISETNNKLYINEVDNFSNYSNSELIVIYTYLNGKDDEEKIDFINSLISDEYEYLVVLTEGLESSSSNYEKSEKKFNCKVVSMLSSIPEELMQISIAKYPSALFIDKSICTGAYSNILGKEEMKKATQLFLGTNCIAYKTNN